MNKQRTIEIVIVLCILAMAAFLRFANIVDQGVLYWDEGMYLNEARFYASVFENAPEIIRDIGAGNSLDQYVNRIEGWLPSAAKPLHGFLIYMLSLIIGLHDYTGQILSGICNMLLMLLCYGMVRRWGNIPEALITLFLLALSPFQVLFSRAGFPEMDSHLFFYAALYCYLCFHDKGECRRYRWLWLTGILYGISVATNYRWVILSPIFVFCEGVLSMGSVRQRVRSMIVHGVVLSIAGACVLVLVDVPYVFIKKSISLPAVFGGFHSQASFYFADLFSQYKWNLFGFRPLYPSLFVFFNGIIITVAVLFGTYSLYKKKDKTAFHVSFLILFYFIFFALVFVKKGYFARYNSIIYLAGTYIAAHGMCAFTTRFMRHAISRVLVCALIVFCAGGGQAVHARDYITVSSGYRATRDYLIQHDGQRCLAYMNSLFEFYFGRNVAERIHGNQIDFVAKITSGDYTHVVIDYGQFSTRSNAFLFADTFLREHCMPVFTVDNPAGSWREVVLENLRRQHETEYQFDILMNDVYVDVIRVYRVGDVYSALVREGYVEA